jgi:hypothetical protein
MNLQLDLCQRIQHGFDLVETPEVVQAWKHRVFSEGCKGIMKLDLTTHFVTWEIKPREVSSPISPALVARSR